MTHTLLRAGALSCALLASTALTGPALAQPNLPAPPAFRHVDENGVDLARGTVSVSIPLGSVGSGPDGLALVRHFGAIQGDNWNIRFRRSESATQATITISLGERSETFTGAKTATSFSSDQGSGATLSKSLSQDGETHVYTLVASDGTTTRFAWPSTLPRQNGATGFCVPGRELSCDLLAQTSVAPSGRSLAFTWRARENCTLTGETYNCVSFYRLSSVSNSSGYAVGFAYQTNSDPANGLPQPAWYERTGATFSNTARGSAVSSVSYSSPSAGVTDLTDTGGRTWRITRNPSGYVTGVRRPGSTSDDVAIAYANATTGEVAQVTADGVATGYARSVSGSTATMTVTDALGRQSTIVSDLAIGRATSFTDPLGRTTAVQYDPNGRPTRITADEGNHTELTYDSRGNVTRTEARPKTGSNLSPIAVTADFPATCTNAVTCNQPTSTTDARGHTTDYAYDPIHGGIASVTAPAPTPGATRPQTRFTYALTGGAWRPTRISACQTGSSCTDSADEARTTFAYDANGNVLSTTSGNGAGTLSATSEMSYDDAGNLTAVDGPLTGAADTVRFRYDAARQRVGTVSPDPDGAGLLKHRAERLTYRPDGQASRIETGTVDSQSDSHWAAFAALEQVDVGFDSANRPVTSALSAGGTVHALSQTSYDALGRPECAAQRMNPAAFGSLPASACSLGTQGSFGPDRIARTIRDPAGQVTEVRTAVGTALEATEVRSTYTDNGRVETLADGMNNLTTLEYDGHDRLVRTRFPVPTQGANASSTIDYEELGYDPAGNVISRRNRAGETAGYTFDALDRLTLKDLPGSEPDVAYGYDLLGRLTSASQAGHALGFTYDALGRQLTQTNPMGTVTSTWDLAGRRTRITHPGAVYYVDQDYLVTGEMTAIREYGATSGLGVIAAFGYDQLGRRISLTRGNGTVTSYAYDAASRLQTLSLDLAGTASDLTLGFAYNPAGQIVANTRSNDAYSWAAPAGTTASTVNGRNQLADVNGAAASHDLRGNLTAQGGRSFAYSSENLLTGIAYGTRTHELSYDPLMRFYHITTSGATSRTFLQDGLDEIATYKAGVILNRTVFGPDGEPLYQLDAWGPIWFHADERGSIVAWSTASGAISSTPTAFDEYGENLFSLGLYGYAGGHWLPPRLFRFGARVYDPSLGRFLQPDPIGYGDGMNMYAYVRADPVNLVDPTGEVVEIIRNGNNIRLTFRIAYYGRGATRAVTSRFDSAIEGAWTGRFGNFNVRTTVISVRLNDFPRPEIVRGNQNWNFVNIPEGNGRASVTDSRFGRWPSQRPNSTVAHEAGHLANVRDMYNRVTGAPLPGYANSIMGASGQPVTEVTIRDLLVANGLASGHEPLRGLLGTVRAAAGTGSGLLRTGAEAIDDFLVDHELQTRGK